MSNRDSLGFGDLLPQDVVQIFAQEKHGKRGHKKRSHSLGRALVWLKGKKRKDVGTNGRNPGLGPALDLALDGHSGGNQGGNKGGQKAGRQAHQHGNNQGAPKRNDDDKTPAPPLLQENVFIEGSRPKYLEDLHTEAQEGLKMMQQEETSIGVEYQDNMSTISTMSVQTDGEGGGFTTDSTMADTSSVVSVQSSVSTRSGLTRQGSTFRPLNSGKKSEKTKRRRHRKTVAGIPHHVQRDLGLDRVGWTIAQKLEEELYNGETDESPTAEVPQRSDTKVIQALNEDQVKQLNAAHAGHRDDLALLQRLGPDFSEGERPRSLAVPWMTTANSRQQELPSPVITMSPQAAYMSKIIPNAVLPPSIEVVEINRGRSRNSVRTVSKSSLLLSSPAPSRASSRASSSRTTSSKASTITSASCHNHQSDSSCWSNSESSETLVSDSSTISGHSTLRQKKSRNGDFSSKEDKVSVHSSSSKASKCTSNGMLVGKENMVKKDGQFVRSLSVMKSKKAPPPPSRSYSLHKMKRRSRDLAEVTVISAESSRPRIPPLGEENEKNTSPSSPSIIDSPGYNADTSSLDESTGSASFSPFKARALKMEEAANVEGTVFIDSSKQMQESVQGKKPGKISISSGYSSQDPTSPQLSKPPHSSSPKHKRGILAKLQKLFPGSSAGSAPLPLTQPGAPENIKNREGDIPDLVDLSPSVRALRELFNIPPPPKVHAPPPPPPEVWVHSKRSIELLLGPPVPDNIDAIIKKNPKDRRQQRHSPCLSTEGVVKSLVVDRKQKNPAAAAESIGRSLHVMEGRQVQESMIMENETSKRLTQNVDLKGNQVVEASEKARVSDILNVMIVKAVEKREETLVAAIREEEEPRKTEVNIHMDTTPAISLVRISPSPSPALSHHPPQTLAKKTIVTSVKPVTSPESSWPPPPPPIAQAGADDVDFPLPPPPFIGETALVLPVQVLSTTISVVITEAEPQTQPLSIPPPPSYSAPHPPLITVSPPTIKKVCPPITEVSLSPPKVISPPPPIEIPLPSPKVISTSPPKVIPPPPPTEVSLSLSKLISPPPPTAVSLTPPKVISPPPPPPIEISLPSPKVISPPPPIEVTPSPPKVISPPPAPPILVSLPPPKVIPPPPPTVEVSVPPLKVISQPSPPKKVSLPSLSEEVAPKELFPQPPDFLPPSPKESSPPPPKDDSPVRPQQSCPPQVQDVPFPLVVEVSPLPPKEVAAVSTEEVPEEVPSQENDSVEVCVSKMEPPKNIPPPPPLPSEQDANHSKENVQPECDSILIAPQSIPPLPHKEPLHQPDVIPTNEVPHLPASEISIPQVLEEPAASPIIIPVPPPLPVQGLTSIQHESGTVSKENQSQELPSARVVQEEPTPVVTPALLQMVKLRSVNSSPVPPDAEEHPQVEVTMRASNQVPTPSTNGEAPQKPIRKSLILISPTSTSPPIQVTLQTELSKPQSLVAPTVSLSTIPSPTKKSPPATTLSPSMNLQEAIRLRTAARSKDNPASHRSLHSPKSPDLRTSPRSPSSTASFIFSKSNKKVVIETKPASEAKTSVQNNLEVSAVTKAAAASEAASLTKAGKVPPPVAKKPKSKAKENETIEGTEQTAGQDAQKESIQDAAEKTNGTSGTAEGGETPST